MNPSELMRQARHFRDRLPLHWSIEEINCGNMADFNTTNDPFTLFGRMIPSYAQGVWSVCEELFEEPRSMHYPLDALDPSSFIAQNDRCIIFAYISGQCVGQVRFARNWNRYVHIADLAVKQEFRRQNVGRILILATIQWAVAHHHVGISLESQDVNLAACRFYRKLGFTLGGFDEHFYQQIPEVHGQGALYWYLDIIT